MNSNNGWWESLRHTGLFLGPNEIRVLENEYPLNALDDYSISQLRRELNRLEAGETERGAFVARVLEQVCGLSGGYGEWKRASAVDQKWAHRLLSGETRKPAHLWTGSTGGYLPVFIEASKTNLGVGKSRKFISDVVQWLRLARQPVALATNTRQWRLIYAGMDYEAGCEWDIDLWFQEGEPGPQLLALRLLLQPELYRPQPSGQLRIEELVNEARKGQAELSAVLGERVREAVEILVRAHGEALKEAGLEREGAEIYRAAVRIVMRMVVVLFAESRELLPLANPNYFSAYSLQGLIETLQKLSARGTGRLDHRFSAWPRLLALFRLIYEGSHHEALQVPDYGGELFEPGKPDAAGADMRALHVLETACFESRTHDAVPDKVVWKVLDLLTRTRVRIRQGRGSTQVVMPVDFSALSSEYIGILYEGLLDYELRTAPGGDPIIFLAIGNEPALPLSRLEQMEDKQIKELLANLKDTSSDSEGEAGDEVVEEESDGDGEQDADNDEEEADPDSDPDSDFLDTVEQAKQRALEWARKVVELAKLVKKPAGSSPERKLVYEQKVESKSRQLVCRIVLPGEWYLVRWGGTRKGSGTFYTRPQLAVPTVQRTLQPLACERNESGEWIPRKPEEILALKLCDPSCGSGSFVLAGLRYITEVLYESLFIHGRLHDEEDRTVLKLLGERDGEDGERLSDELIPCRVGDEHFEGRVKAVLRRHVVERCIYGVDIDPLSVELCRLSLWIETMDRNLPFSFLDHKIRCGNSLVGAWFDQFQHYPAMAWKNREGGDKAHTNGVHFAKEELTKAIKAWAKDVLAPDLAQFLGGADLFQEDLQAASLSTHDTALEAFQSLHDIPIHESRQRAQRFRELLESPAYRQLKDAFDRWCACWFWPGDRLDNAPLPTNFHQPAAESADLVRRIAAEKRFFHWELEFPDVFSTSGSGFDAILGNPPWEIAKPNSKEFFSNIDPLYRAYGKQEAIRKQTDYFADARVEKDWILYLADLKAQGNFLRYAENPFGDPDKTDKSPDKFTIARGKANAEYHEQWRIARNRSQGYVDPEHPFRHQGSADINLYKLFLEAAHGLLRKGGRLGIIVPSGIYSDNGTGALRELFINHCSWEWLFGFENREKLFDIDSRFKFNPVIVQKSGETTAIRTAFMRRKLVDWENAEDHAIDYPKEQVEQFSPWSKAILEIQSEQDLEILKKIYANSVLLGDPSEKGWGIQYAREFDMTNDSKLFPPREKWEAQGYQPDEYSRWLKGDWRPVRELWRELGVDPLPDGQTRCAQPPYDRIPIPRADIPVGIILNREATEWIREEAIEDTALPLYEGRMIGQYDFSNKGWVSGKGRGAIWRDIPWERKVVEPQFLIASREFSSTYEWARSLRISHMRIGSATNSRSTVATPTFLFPGGDTAAVFVPDSAESGLFLSAVLSSAIFDYVMRSRLVGLHMDYHVFAACPLPSKCEVSYWNRLINQIANLSVPSVLFAPVLLRVFSKNPNCSFNWAIQISERVRLISSISSVFCGINHLNADDIRRVLQGCDFPKELIRSEEVVRQLNPKGFWRVDKDKPPELRQTVLTLVAFHDLQQKIAQCGGDREKGIEVFCNQNDGEGWMIPETLRLADYGLGHDERAQEHQPVAGELGPRFYDWQLAQSAEESWRECELHARNLLGEAGYQQLLAGIEAEKRGEKPQRGRMVAEEKGAYGKESSKDQGQGLLNFGD